MRFEEIVAVLFVIVIVVITILVVITSNKITEYYSCGFPNQSKEYVMIKTEDEIGDTVFVCVEGKEAWHSGTATMR